MSGDKVELRALALAATPGPWQAMTTGSEGASVVVEHREGRVRRVARVTDGAFQDFDANAAYIAAASPDVILGLLDERDALREGIGLIAQAASGWTVSLSDIERWCGELQDDPATFVAIPIKEPA